MHTTTNNNNNNSNKTQQETARLSHTHRLRQYPTTSKEAIPTGSAQLVEVLSHKRHIANLPKGDCNAFKEQGCHGLRRHGKCSRPLHNKAVAGATCDTRSTNKPERDVWSGRERNRTTKQKAYRSVKENLQHVHGRQARPLACVPTQRTEKTPQRCTRRSGYRYAHG